MKKVLLSRDRSAIFKQKQVYVYSRIQQDTVSLYNSLTFRFKRNRYTVDHFPSEKKMKKTLVHKL